MAMEAMDCAAFPLEAKGSVDIGGICTEIVCSVFANQVFVIITQVNKVGSVLKAWSEPRIDGGSRYLIENMLGRRDDPLLNLYARQLVERFNQVSPKPLLLAISLKDEGRGTEHFQAVVNKAVDLVVQLQ